MRKKISLGVIIVLAFWLCACSNSSKETDPGSIDGHLFHFVKEVVLEEEVYHFYAPNHLDDVATYYYEQGQVQSSKSLWVINLEKKIQYRFMEEPSNEILTAIYESVGEMIPEIVEVFDLNLTTYENGSIEVFEERISNPSMQEIGYVFVELFIPFKMISNTTKVTSTVMVPLGHWILKREGDYVASLDGTKMVLWNEFYYEYELKLIS